MADTIYAGDPATNALVELLRADAAIQSLTDGNHAYAGQLDPTEYRIPGAPSSGPPTRYIALWPSGDGFLDYFNLQSDSALEWRVDIYTLNLDLGDRSDMQSRRIFGALAKLLHNKPLTVAGFQCYGVGTVAHVITTDDPPTGGTHMIARIGGLTFRAMT